MAIDREDVSSFYESQLGKRMVKSEVALLLHELHKGEKVLDIGSNIGLIERHMAGIDITGMESSDELLSTARRSSKSLFVKGKAENLPFLKETFNVVLFSVFPDVVVNYAIAIKEAIAVLKPKGKVIILTVNKDSAYFEALTGAGHGYADAIRSVKLDFVESIMPKDMKLIGIRKVCLMGEAAANADDLYALVYSKA
ncbi:Methyltransferase type 11 [mine drainage metagenome]|uniref:Methyltransferase type 11 n=1 Tax=mine drainage metagenome TaxID=410659 RepID=T0Y2Z4_9ZZZZ